MLILLVDVKPASASGWFSHGSNHDAKPPQIVLSRGLPSDSGKVRQSRSSAIRVCPLSAVFGSDTRTNFQSGNCHLYRMGDPSNVVRRFHGGLM